MFPPLFFEKGRIREWFATIITGLMVRSDSLGITSIIRDLVLNPSLYHCMKHFFRADPWDWDDILTKWTKNVSRYAPFKQISGRTVLIGDGVKRASDERYMPSIKKIVQNRKVHPSPRLSTGTFLAPPACQPERLPNLSASPLSTQIHDGDCVISDWLGDESVSHVVQMLRDGFRAEQYFGDSLFVLDSIS